MLKYLSIAFALSVASADLNRHGAVTSASASWDSPGSSLLSVAGRSSSAKDDPSSETDEHGSLAQGDEQGQGTKSKVVSIKLDSERHMDNAGLVQDANQEKLDSLLAGIKAKVANMDSDRAARRSQRKESVTKQDTTKQKTRRDRARVSGESEHKEGVFVQKDEAIKQQSNSGEKVRHMNGAVIHQDRTQASRTPRVPEGPRSHRREDWQRRAGTATQSALGARASNGESLEQLTEARMQHASEARALQKDRATIYKDRASSGESLEQLTEARMQHASEARVLHKDRASIYKDDAAVHTVKTADGAIIRAPREGALLQEDDGVDRKRAHSRSRKHDQWGADLGDELLTKYSHESARQRHKMKLVSNFAKKEGSSKHHSRGFGAWRNHASRKHSFASVESHRRASAYNHRKTSHASSHKAKSRSHSHF